MASAEIRLVAEMVIKVESDEMTQEQMDSMLATGGTMDSLARDFARAITLDPRHAPSAYYGDDACATVTDIVSSDREMGSVERAES